MFTKHFRAIYFKLRLPSLNSKRTLSLHYLMPNLKFVFFNIFQMNSKFYFKNKEIFFKKNSHLDKNYIISAYLVIYSLFFQSYRTNK